MNIVIALMFFFAPPPTRPPCYAIHASSVVYLHMYPIQSSGDIYATQAVTATNGLITDTVTLRRPFVVPYPPRMTTLTTDRPYVAYVCKSGRAPGVMYLPLV